MTYQELLETFSLLYEQVYSSSVDKETRGKFINLACDAVTNRFEWSWRKKYKTDTTDGTSTYTLPSDISNSGIIPDTLYIDESIWTEIQPNEVVMYSTDSEVYHVTGNNRDGYTLTFPCSVPDSGLTLEFYYYQTHPTLSDDSDISIIPDGECVANIAVGRFLKSEGEGDEGFSWLQDGENGVSDMLEEERRKKPIVRVRKTQRTKVNQFDITAMY